MLAMSCYNRGGCPYPADALCALEPSRVRARHGTTPADGLCAMSRVSGVTLADPAGNMLGAFPIRSPERLGHNKPEHASRCERG